MLARLRRPGLQYDRLPLRHGTEQRTGLGGERRTDPLLQFALSAALLRLAAEHDGERRQAEFVEPDFERHAGVGPRHDLRRLGSVEDRVHQRGAEYVTGRVAEHAGEPRIQSRLDLRREVVVRNARPCPARNRLQGDNNALGVAARAVWRVDGTRFRRPLLLVERLHGRARAVHVAPGDLEHAFGDQEVADGIHLVEQVVDDSRDRRLVRSSQHQRRLGRCEDRADARGPVLGNQADAVDDVARRNRFLRFVARLVARRHQRKCAPQFEDVL